MESIKKKLSAILDTIRRSCADHRVTVVGVEVFTLYLLIWVAWGDMDIEYDSALADFLFHDWALLVFFPLFIFAAMFVESLFTYEKRQRNILIARMIGFLLGVVVAAMFVWGMRLEDSVEISQMQGDILAEWCQRFVFGYVILLLLGIVYVCHRKSGVGFIEYLLHVLVNFAAATAIYFVLCFGVSLVLLVVDLLFLDGYSSLVGYGIILVTGIYYAPACIMAMNNMDNEVRDPLGIILIKYVMTGMTFCALGVVYVYLLKILIMWEIPSNEIFGIVAGLFCLGMPIWIIDYFFKDETKYMWFLQKAPYSLIPLIPVQTYAISVRIYHNGMTPSRYMGVLLILFEIVMLLVWRFWLDKPERVLLILSAGVVVAVLLPGINMYSVSNRWQSAFLKSYYNKVLAHEELTQEEYERLKGAYDYLKWKPEMKQFVKMYDINDSEFAQQLANAGVNKDELTQIQYHSIHCCQMVGELSLDGYSRFAMLNQDEGYEENREDKIQVDFAAFRFYKRGSEEQEIITVDLSDFANRCMDYKEENPDAGKEQLSEAMRPYNRIVIDENTVLYLNHFEIDYRDGIKDGENYFEVVNLNVSGMLLR